MIKSATNKPDFFAEVRRVAADAHAVPVRLGLVGSSVKLYLDKDGTVIEHLLVRGRTGYGALATFQKWSRWMEELLSQLATEQAKHQHNDDNYRRLAEDRPAPADAMTQAEVEQWAAARLGWTVFFITARFEGGQAVVTAQPRSFISGAGNGGIIFVSNGNGSNFGSIPLHMVMNSGAKLGAMSCPNREILEGAPVMAYAVLDPDNPEIVVKDQIAAFNDKVTSRLKALAREELAARLAALADTAAGVFPCQVMAPSLLCYRGEGPHFPDGMEPGPVVRPASGALSSTRYTYTAPLEGWQDPDTVRRQRDLLAWCVLELIACADPNRDACEIRRARDLVGQVRHLGAPV